MKIRLKDSVIVRTGKDRGQTGTVTRIFPDKETVVVEGVNKKTKHVKGRDGNPGERVEFFAPIHISNVSLIDPKSGKATRVRIQKDGKDKTRVSTASGQVITGEESAKKTEKDTKKSSPTKKTK